MKKTIMRMAAMLFAVALLVGAMPVTNYAAVSNVTYKVEEIFATPQQKVYVVNQVTGEKTEKALYCIQHDNIWPTATNKEGAANKATTYTLADKDEYLLTDEQIEVIKKILFAGYPYNGKGYANELVSWGMDDAAAGATQAIVWNYVKSCGVPANTKDAGLPTSEEDPILRGLTEKIVAYANSDESITPPSSSNITIKGTGVLAENDGVWETEVTIVNPAGWNPTYNLKLPEGVKAVDAQGNEIASVEGGVAFKLVAQDAESVKAGSVLKVETELTYPTNFQQYNTTDMYKDGFSGNTYPYQTMITLDIETVDMNGSLALTTKSADDPDDDGDDDGNKDNKGDDDKGAVNTSDNSPIAPFAGLFAASVAGIVAVVRARRRA